ncbi:MAG: carbamoyltransferase HypF, partial [Lentisphaeria bacterium]|nr:carbamoyltransferase HypF [Lentisphaeria bacterium]
LESLPYDRERTSMKKFPMCPECGKEYYSIESRRYDAQPVCCNDCGPSLYLLGSDLKNGDAITRTRQMLMAGAVVAIKGIGGFHLACNARNRDAVERFRRLKNRPRKPFTVMMKDMAVVKKECVVTEAAGKWLDGCEKPILLLDKKTDSTLPENLAPGNPTLGVMLPYAPLQMLLFDYPDGVENPDALVMTSGNVSGAPICRSEEEASQEIGVYCDAILSHDRDIRLRADDSVMTLYNDQPYMIRRSRGFAPLPLDLELDNSKNVLAIGAELKNAFCIVKKDLAYCAPHIGDMEDLRSVDALNESVNTFSNMLEFTPDKVVCDLHPGYHTTAIAESLKFPVCKVQHHWAHILSSMAENRVYEPVIGVALDGTGSGTDGKIWGGEVLIAGVDKFERFSHIKYFPLPGGDSASRAGWRIAAGLCHIIDPEYAADTVEKLNICTPQEYKFIAAMIKNRINTVESSSAGRFFDAVSSLLGIANKSTFEGDAAMSLEFAAAEFLRTAAALPALPEICWQEGNEIMPADELFRLLLKRRLRGEDVRESAYIFHRGLADMIIKSCEKAREKSSLNICALSGGTFQNKLLLDLCVNGLQKCGFKVLLHRLIPANDGGISLGQALYGIFNQ